MHTDPAAAATPASPAAPLDRDVLCPLCEYNLRGLTEPRCPECGYPFTWEELNDPARRRHPFLFEHHPERNYWSFCKTALGAVRPRRFWHELHPTQPSRPARLVIYWTIGAGVFISLVGLLAVADLTQIWIAINGGTLGQAFASGNLIALLQSRDVLSVIVVSATIPLAWAWLSFIALLVFQASMQRARVRTMHVLRCVLYGFDLVPLGLATAVNILIDAVALWASPGSITRLIWSGNALTAVVLIAAIDRVIVAYRLYLRFDHPLATVVSSQVIVLLVAINVAALPLWL